MVNYRQKRACHAMPDVSIYDCNSGPSIDGFLFSGRESRPEGRFFLIGHLII